MKKLLLPLVLGLVGLAGGLAAGHFLSAPQEEAHAEAPPHGEAADHPAEAHAAPPPAAEPMTAAEAHPDAPPPPYDPKIKRDYAKLDRQFVAPIVEGDKVVALILVSLSLEVDPGMSTEVFAREPKLRDRFLQVLFRHAQSGAFEGVFTSGPVMQDLRDSLLEAAQSVMGPVVHAVLVTDILRQDI